MKTKAIISEIHLISALLNPDTPADEIIVHLETLDDLKYDLKRAVEAENPDPPAVKSGIAPGREPGWS